MTMKHEEVFSSTRTFSLYTFEASHRRLDFRSGKTKEFPARLSLVFQDVRVLDTRAYLDSLTVTVADPSALKDFPSKPGETIEPGHKVFLLVSKGWKGFVIAGDIFAEEDQGGFFDPSKLLAG